MSTLTRPAPTFDRPTPPAPLARVVGFEVTKLLSQWRVRLALVACWVAPAVFVAAVSQQSSLPADTVFGRWMHQSGWAGALVVLAFACTWALPLLASLVAGDVFAVEDRLGTWRHLVVAVRSPQRIFAAKVAASSVVILLLALGLLVSSVVGGLLAVGAHPLVGLTGQQIGPGRAFATLLLAWACVLAPTLVCASVGWLGSVTLGRSPIGLLVPALLALVMQLAQMLPLPLAVRLALPSQGFLSWRGLFAEPTQKAPLLVGIAVCLCWTLVATTLAHRLMVRRDFADTSYDGSGRSFLLGGVLPLLGVAVISVALLALTTPGGTGVERPRVEQTLATSFAHLYRLQTDQRGRPPVTEAELRTSARCDKGGVDVEDRGPGNDWRCVVSWHLPGAVATGRAIYQLDVAADGRFVADGDGPKDVNGYFQVRTPVGDAPNPLWQIDGLVDLLPH